MTIPADITAAIDALISAAGRAYMAEAKDDGLSAYLARMSAETAAAELECRAALVAAIRAHLSPPLTVGAALARPEVRLSGSAIEVDCPVWGWTQIVVDAGVIAWRTADTDPDGAFEMWPREWLTDEMRVDLLALPCRLVPADEADLDPTTRSKT